MPLSPILECPALHDRIPATVCKVSNPLEPNHLCGHEQGGEVTAKILVLLSQNFQFQKAFVTWLPFDIGNTFAGMIGNSRGPLSETFIGRRQHPKFFARLWAHR